MSEPSEEQSYVALINRLRGIYTIPVNDGAGPLNGSDTFSRKFDGVPPINGYAADALYRLATWVHGNSDSPPELHDLSAKVLNRPSLCHGCDEVRWEHEKTNNK
jgi:hypothetical protein